MNDRDELTELLAKVDGQVLDGLSDMFYGKAANAIVSAGFRKVFDGDCGLSNIKDPTDREAAEAWMRWANIVTGNGHDGIAAMKQMLTEFGYRKVKP